MTKIPYTLIAAYPISCLAHRNFPSITPAKIRADNVNRDVPPYDKKMYVHLPTLSQLHRLHSIEYENLCAYQIDITTLYQLRRYNHIAAERMNVFKYNFLATYSKRWWINENNAEKNDSFATSGSIPTFIFNKKMLETCHDSRCATWELSLNLVEQAGVAATISPQVLTRLQSFLRSFTSYFPHLNIFLRTYDFH